MENKLISVLRSQNTIHVPFFFSARSQAAYLNLRHIVGYFPLTGLMIETAKACKEDENHLTHGAKPI